jgi:subtilase family serine protease
MGITINQEFMFDNLPPQSNTYMTVGTGSVYMELTFDESNNRVYILNTPYGHWLNLEAYQQGLEPVVLKRSMLFANAQQVGNLSQFVHDSLAAGLAHANVTDITVDYIPN